MSKNKILFLIPVLLLATFTFVQAVFSATTSTDGVTNISATYTNTNTGGGGGGGGGDTTAPSNISNLIVTAVTTNSVTLQWTAPGDDGPDGIARQYLVRYTTSGYITDETVWASATTAFGPPAPQIGGTVQTMVVSGLNSNTTYYFAIKTVDDASNWSGLSNSTSGQTTLVVDTVPPEFTSITALAGNRDWPYPGVAVQWQTNEVVMGGVFYGRTTDYELGFVSSTPTVVGDSLIAFLDGIFQISYPDTLFHFKIKIIDLSGNVAFSTDQTFTTYDDAPPVISQITVQPHINDATITWLTDEPADSQAAYGISQDALNFLKTDATLAVNHDLNLTALTANTRYYYSVRSTDANGNQGTTSVFFFNTLPDPNPPANVANFRAQPGNRQIALSWSNPSDPDYAGVVIRRATTGYPQHERDGAQVYRGLDSGLTDTGLENGVLYYYSAFAYDTSGNYASGALASATPQGTGTPEIPPTGCVGTACITPTSTTPVSPSGQLVFNDWEFFTARRSVKVVPVSAGILQILSSQDLIVSLNAQKLKQPAQEITLQLSDSTYRLDVDRFGNYSTDVMAPVLPYKYNAVLRVKYLDENITPDVLPFSVEVVPGGLVYDNVMAGRPPLTGATVELYFLNTADVWEKWNADAYKQNNPQTVTDLGNYGFVVPGGTYYLRVSHDGYRAYESNRFAISAYGILNQSIGLTSAPPELASVIDSEAPIAQNVVNVAKNLGQKTVYATQIAVTETIKVLTNPEVKKATEQVAAPIIAGAVIVTTAAAEASQILMYLRFLFTQPILVFFRRKRKGWGVVYNSLTKMPVDLVIVRLVDADSRRIMQSRVTDKNGRYAFIVAPGRYKIEINLDQFVFPTHFLAELKDDGAFVDVYHGEVIEVRDKGALVAVNIPLDPVGAQRPVGKIIRQLIGRRLQNVLSIVSLVLAVAFVFITPGILTIGLLVVQVVFYILFRRVAVSPKPKSWGIVYDEGTKHPLQTVVARIFDKQYNKLLESQVTDNHGRYSFLVGRNEYYITYEKNGFQKHQTDPIDLRNHPEASTSVGVDVGLKQENKEINSK